MRMHRIRPGSRQGTAALTAVAGLVVAAVAAGCTATTDRDGGSNQAAPATDSPDLRVFDACVGYWNAISGVLPVGEEAARTKAEQIADDLRSAADQLGDSPDESRAKSFLLATADDAVEAMGLVPSPELDEQHYWLVTQCVDADGQLMPRPSSGTADPESAGDSATGTDATQSTTGDGGAALTDDILVDRAWNIACLEGEGPLDVEERRDEAGPSLMWEHPSIATDPAAPSVHIDIANDLRGDIDGDGRDDRIVKANCWYGNDWGASIEVWSVDAESGEPSQLPSPYQWDKFSAADVRLAVEDGRIVVTADVPAPGETHPHLNGYAFVEVSEYVYEGPAWFRRVVESRPRSSAAGYSSVEDYLSLFAQAWGAQDRETLLGLADPEVVDVAMSTGPGEADVFYGDECLMGSSGVGGCTILFLPSGQTECCAQIWEVTYMEVDQGAAIRAIRLEFQGDAG